MSNARSTPAGAPSPGRGQPPAQGSGDVPSITNAPEPLSEDQARRTRRYLVQMGIRLVCFLSAIFLARGILWLQMVLLAAAVVLPYSAVLFANAGRDRVTYDTSPFVGADLPALRAPAASASAPAPAPAGDPASPSSGPGRVIEHQDDEAPDDTDAREDTDDTRDDTPGTRDDTPATRPDDPTKEH